MNNTMIELFDTELVGLATNGHILIIDDDPVAAGVLSVALTDAGYTITEAYSGEAALAELLPVAGKMAGVLPDMVILDIEMGMGIDGYETCRRLRANATTRYLPVIFLSGHDQLDDRMHAYDVGGSDFMAKPFVPAEVLRKARMGILYKHREEALNTENRPPSGSLKSAITGLDDTALALKFCRSALACHTLRGIGALVIESMSSFGISCYVQLRTSGETLTLSARGAATPLVESVIEMSRTMGRIFSFKDRMIINHESLSLLITDMPAANEMLCGRIRDQAAIIAGAAELAVGNIRLRVEAMARSAEMRHLADASRKTVEVLREGYRERQLATRLGFESMTNSIEATYAHLALSNNQELSISDTVHSVTEQMLGLFEDNGELDNQFARLFFLLVQLNKAGIYTIPEENEAPPPNIQIF
jgi:CheY-like chemotaxis protein